MGNMDLAKRKSQRLREFSYSETAAYFITVICFKRKHLLGRIDPTCAASRKPVRGGVPDAPRPEISNCAEITVELSGIGKIVDAKIREMDEKFPGVSIDHFVIMPNHVHLLLSVDETCGASRTPPLTGSTESKTVRSNETIPRFISYLKRSTNRVAGAEIWHRGYHDHIIRDCADYMVRYKYISDNPARWAEDEYYV